MGLERQARGEARAEVKPIIISGKSGRLWGPDVEALKGFIPRRGEPASARPPRRASRRRAA